tara:strand:+ start:888 stop:1082 length:195 start_codon:yes stop_codon:yes gene_type:complete
MNNKQSNPKKRYLKIPMATKQKEKNNIYETIDTKESKKCIKKEKQIDLENIFIKSKKNIKKDKK